MPPDSPDPANPRLRHFFLRGMVSGLPFMLVIIPFGILFGVVATEAGFTLLEVMGFSVMVVAGASQFAAVQMMADNAPTVMVLVAALAVNLRMAMYSAALSPHLGQASMRVRAVLSYFMTDQAYACSFMAYEADRTMTLPEKLSFYAGVVVLVCIPWYVFTYLGATLGNRIPPEFALDFAVPITFIAMVAPMLRSVPHVAAAAASVVLALLLAWMPYNTGMLIAALGAMAVGAQAELVLKRRAEAGR